MKIQDIVFLIVLLILVFKRSPFWATMVGMAALIISIPLFSLWIFFTAERLTWYAVGFFILAMVLLCLKLGNQKNKKNSKT